MWLDYLLPLPAAPASTYWTGSNSFSACSPSTPWSNTRPLRNNSLTRNVLSSRSLPGINSARNVTCIPGRAQTFGTFVGRLGRTFFFFKKALATPNAPAASAKPPTKRFVRFFIQLSLFAERIETRGDRW